MKVKGFTISEIAINMLVGGLIIMFSITFIFFQNRLLINQVNQFGGLQDLHLFQNVMESSFEKATWVTATNNSLSFYNSVGAREQHIIFTPDSILISLPKPHLIGFKGVVTTLIHKDSIINHASIEVMINERKATLIYNKIYNDGILLNL